MGLLLALLLLMMVFSVPAWPYSAGWGYYPSGGAFLLLIILAIVFFGLELLFAFLLQQFLAGLGVVAPPKHRFVPSFLLTGWGVTILLLAVNRSTPLNDNVQMTVLEKQSVVPACLETCE